MKRAKAILVVFLLVATALAACGPATQQPTPTPTAVPVATASPTPTPQPTSIFHQVSAADFLVAFSQKPGEEFTPAELVEANKWRLEQLAGKIDGAVRKGSLPETTTSREVIFTFAGINEKNVAGEIGAIVLDRIAGRAYLVDEDGKATLWVEKGVVACPVCRREDSSESGTFITHEDKRLYQIEATDVTGYVSRLQKTNAVGNPTDEEPKDYLVISAVHPDGGQEMVLIPAHFLEIPEGKVLKRGVNGFLNPVAGEVDFYRDTQDGHRRLVATWNPVEGEWVRGSEEDIFEEKAAKPAVELAGFTVEWQNG